MLRALPNVLLISLGGILTRRVTPQELSAFSLGGPRLARPGRTRIALFSFSLEKIMSAINDTLNSAGSILNDVVRFGIGLAGAALVAGVLFPGDYSIVNNVAGLVDSFNNGTLTGLITLLLFMTFMRR